MNRRETQPRTAGLRPIIGASGPVREAQTFAGRSLLTRYVNLVRLPHTIFALPFALLGVVYASHFSRVTWTTVGLVIAAFTAARFAAMGFNRIADRRFDALNPRTRSRELPAGLLSVPQAAVSVVVAAGLFVLCAGLLNPLCLILSPIALAWVLAYSFTKRFTNWSHLWLGTSLAIAPVGGFLAVAGSWSTPSWTLYVLAAAVAFWVSGFDVFYALQDESFDREHKLRSLVTLVGARKSVSIAKLMHLLALTLLIVFGIGAGFGWYYYVGVGIAGALLAWEHRLVRPDDLKHLNAAFFTMNGVVSIVVFLGALAQRLL